MRQIMSMILQIESIISDPKIRNGAPVIFGTGIRVVDVVTQIYSGDKLTPEEFAEQFHVDLGHVHAALAYYHLHKDELEPWMQQNNEDTAELIEKLIRAGKGIRLERD